LAELKVVRSSKIRNDAVIIYIIQYHQ